MGNFIKDMNSIWSNLPEPLKDAVKSKVPLEIQSVGGLLNGILNPKDDNDLEKNVEKDKDDDIIDVEWEEI